MMIVKNAEGDEGEYFVGHYTPAGDFHVLIVETGKCGRCYLNWDEAVSIAGRINGSGAAPHVVPTE
jgi:hypothetical protein